MSIYAIVGRSFVWIIGFGPMSLHWLQGMPFWASWLPGYQKAEAEQAAEVFGWFLAALLAPYLQGEGMILEGPS
jgi:hypothetical protein